MNLVTWFAIYGGIIALILGFGGVLDILIKEEDRRQLGDWLAERVERDPGAWIQGINRAFLRLFDRLFSSRWSLIEGCIWVGLILAPVWLVVIRAADLISPTTNENTADMLILAMVLALAIASLFSFSVIAIVIGGGIVFGIVIVIGIGVVIVSVIVSGIVSVIVIGMVIFIVIGIFIVIAIVSVVVVVRVFVIGRSPKDIRIPVSPMAALLYSLVSIGIVSGAVGAFRPDVLASFPQAIEAEGFKVLAFVAFNLFGDSVSLLETWWVLRQGSEASLPKLLGLLVLDVALSAAIFLLLPLILWEIPAFLEAARFRGERPWLGILFWSTFSTSVTFYLFVAAALLVRPLSRVVVWGRHLDVQKHPVLALTFAAAVVVTLLFWGGLALYKVMA